MPKKRTLEIGALAPDWCKTKSTVTCRRQQRKGHYRSMAQCPDCGHCFGGKNKLEREIKNTKRYIELEKEAQHWIIMGWRVEKSLEKELIERERKPEHSRYDHSARLQERIVQFRDNLIEVRIEQGKILHPQEVNSNDSS